MAAFRLRGLSIYIALRYLDRAAGGMLPFIYRFAEPSSIAPNCSGELNIRGRSGSNCADAKVYTIGGGTAISLRGRRNGLREYCYTSWKAFCEANVGKMRLNAAVKLDRGMRSIGGPHTTI